MGYQEYAYKLDKPEQFIKCKKEIDDYMYRSLIFEHVDYQLVEFKEKLGEMDSGVYLFVYGDRWNGIKLIKKLGEKLKSSYIKDVETSLGFYNESEKIYNENSDKLKNIFKNKSNIGVVLLESPRDYKHFERER